MKIVSKFVWLLIPIVTLFSGCGSSSLSGKSGNSSPAVPVITLTTPAPGTVYNASSTVFSGTASDENGISAVTVQAGSGNPVPAEGTANWSYTYNGDFIMGSTNILTIRAMDAAGNSASIQVGFSVTQTNTFLTWLTNTLFTNTNTLFTNTNTTLTNHQTNYTYNIISNVSYSISTTYICTQFVTVTTNSIYTNIYPDYVYFIEANTSNYMDLALGNYLIEDSFGTNFNSGVSTYSGLSTSALIQLIPAADFSGMFFMKFARWNVMMDTGNDSSPGSSVQGTIGWTTANTRDNTGKWTIVPTSNVSGIQCFMLSNYISNLCINSKASGGANTPNSQLEWAPYTANTVYQDWMISNAITDAGGAPVSNVASVYMSSNYTIHFQTNMQVITNATNYSFITNAVLSNGFSSRKWF